MTDVSVDFAEEQTQMSASQRASDLLSRFGMILVLGVVIVLAQVAYSGFLYTDNLLNLLSQNAPVALVAVGMTFVMIAGGFDLSVAAVFAGGSVLFARLSNDQPVLVALVLTIAVGGLAGVVNGLIITRMKVNPFIATLGTASVFGGLVVFFYPSPVLGEKESFGTLGGDDLLGLPISIWVMVVVFVMFGFILASTKYGRSLYAVGGNQEAARLAGFRVDLLKVSTYVLTGGFAALGGAIIASRTGAGQATIGTAVTLDAIAIVIIGGTSLMGGEGAIWRTVVGVLILGVINNVFQALAVSDAVQQITKGAVVILAVALDAFVRSRRR
ncbi:ribose ABC transporter (permease) [metagenome]|uniref:Ribose ABC transporter (Permease) n=1 Tax=metagenome TaxID=256318 RepID=A0A2P2CA74_9ZZZZ